MPATKGQAAMRLVDITESLAESGKHTSPYEKALVGKDELDLEEAYPLCVAELVKERNVSSSVRYILIHRRRRQGLLC